MTKKKTLKFGDFTTELSMARSQSSGRVSSSVRTRFRDEEEVFLGTSSVLTALEGELPPPPGSTEREEFLRPLDCAHIYTSCVFGDQGRSLLGPGSTERAPPGAHNPDLTENTGYYLEVRHNENSPKNSPKGSL